MFVPEYLLFVPFNVSNMHNSPNSISNVLFTTQSDGKEKDIRSDNRVEREFQASGSSMAIEAKKSEKKRDGWTREDN